MVSHLMNRGTSKSVGFVQLFSREKKPNWTRLDTWALSEKRVSWALRGTCNSYTLIWDPILSFVDIKIGKLDIIRLLNS